MHTPPRGGQRARPLTATCRPPWTCGTGRGDHRQRSAATARAGVTVVCLVPARTDTRWFHDHVLAEGAEVRYVRGRLKFGNATTGAPFASLVVIYRGSPADAELVPAGSDGDAEDVLEVGDLCRGPARLDPREPPGRWSATGPYPGTSRSGYGPPAPSAGSESLHGRRAQLPPCPSGADRSGTDRGRTQQASLRRHAEVARSAAVGAGLRRLGSAIANTRLRLSNVDNFLSRRFSLRPQRR